MRQLTATVMEVSDGAEEDVGGRIRRRWTANDAGNRRPCAQYKAPRDDSLHVDEEDDEADLLVPSVRRGVLWGGGAMASGEGTVVVFPFLCSQRGENRKGGGKVGGGGVEGRR
jgi:hypothetical protein